MPVVGGVVAQGENGGSGARQDPVPLLISDNIANNKATTTRTTTTATTGQQPDSPPRVTPRQTTKDPK